MRRKYRSDALAAIYETMEALHKAGAIGKRAMRRFDEACFRQGKKRMKKGPEERARMMRAFKSRDTAPELAVSDDNIREHMKAGSFRQ